MLSYIRRSRKLCCVFWSLVLGLSSRCVRAYLLAQFSQSLTIYIYTLTYKLSPFLSIYRSIFYLSLSTWKWIHGVHETFVQISTCWGCAFPRREGTIHCSLYHSFSLSLFFFPLLLLALSLSFIFISFSCSLTFALTQAISLITPVSPAGDSSGAAAEEEFEPDLPVTWVYLQTHVQSWETYIFTHTYAHPRRTYTCRKDIQK